MVYSYNCATKLTVEERNVYGYHLGRRWLYDAIGAPRCMAGFQSESMAGFVGIRTMIVDRLIDPD